ncbi:RpoD subfamily RNA polymerase sigma-70 subunit [Nitzschia inconspicua]|uniref:RpoD subfamily RNA polymerase sigma-70 subunit n=1 Tax=Nitzschia inconspicua TaxID=303405 RepID=A0A9K3L7W3_9STRA|nr:RpoD subfamily RNA polymerase sigma-70 subunit [Nitzschia inconspicua]
MMNQSVSPSRKRSAPTTAFNRQRRLWGFVAMAVSMSSVMAFQSSLPHTKGRGRDGATASQVVTEPNNLMQLERRKSLADRAALEELYMLSLTAGSQMTTVNTPKRKTKIKRQVSSSSPKSATATKMQRRKSGSSSSTSTILRALKSEAAEFGDGSVTSSSTTTSSSSSSSSEASPQPSSDKIMNKALLYSPQHAHPQFKGLTTKPNLRNQRKQSLTTVSPVVRNPTLRQDLAKGVTEEERLPMLEYDSAPPEDSVTHPDQQERKSRSSTMPGYGNRSETLREKKYRDGLKLLEQNTGRNILISEEDKRKRKKANGEYMYKNSASVPDSLVHFARELHGIERITPSEEIELGEKTQEAIKLQKIYDGLVTKLKREPTDDEWCAAAGKINMEAIAQAIEEGLQAKNTLVISNLRMVQGVVNVYIKNGLRGQYNSGDLMQEGIMALIRAAEKFDPSRGFRFSTYAMYWIRSAIKRDQLSQSRVIPVPSRLFEQHKRVTKIRRELQEANGRPPTVEELSDASGLTPLQIVRCDEAVAQKIHSLDQNIYNTLKPIQNEQDRDTLYDIVERKTDLRDSDKIEYQLLREDLINALHRHLSEEEANLLMLRYGLVDNKEAIKRSGLRTIAEVSRLAGLKPDKVRRLLNRSLTQLQTVIGDEWRDYERELESWV